MWLKTAGQQLFPTDQTIPCVSVATDLGVVYSYDRQAPAATRDARLPDALAKLDRLREQPRPTAEKASMVQRGVWPAVLYGCEGVCQPKAFFQKLRSRAATAVLGRNKIGSPFLVLGALTSQVVDPQVYAVLQQLLALRRCFQVCPESAVSVVALATESLPAQRSCGPATALALSLPRVGHNGHGRLR